MLKIWARPGFREASKRHVNAVMWFVRRKVEQKQQGTLSRVSESLGKGLHATCAPAFWKPVQLWRSNYRVSDATLQVQQRHGQRKQAP